MNKLETRILNILSKPGDPLTMSKLAAAVYSPIPPVRKIVKNLVDSGKIVRKELEKTPEVKYTRHVINRILKKENDVIVATEFTSLLSEVLPQSSPFASLLKETENQ